MQTTSEGIGQGTLIADRYFVERKLGKGGMGTVYLVTDRLLDNEQLALKLLHADMTHDEIQTKRFLREVQLTRKVTHPNIVRTFDVGKDGESLFFTMEYVTGKTLLETYCDGNIDVETACLILREICLGLSAVHENNIIHRDLKPTNIIITDQGHAKITDFGVAKPSLSNLTAHDEVVGSATHMAPEVWRGGEASVQTDIYSLGLIMYELLVGILPFQGKSVHEFMWHHLNTIPAPLQDQREDAPEWLTQLVDRMLDKNPNCRVESPQQIIFEMDLRLNDMQGEREPLPELEELMEVERPSDAPPPPSRSSSQTSHWSQHEPSISGGFVYPAPEQRAAPDPYSTSRLITSGQAYYEPSPLRDAISLKRWVLSFAGALLAFAAILHLGKFLPQTLWIAAESGASVPAMLIGYGSWMLLQAIFLAALPTAIVTLDRPLLDALRQGFRLAAGFLLLSIAGVMFHLCVSFYRLGEAGLLLPQESVARAFKNGLQDSFYAGIFSYPGMALGQGLLAPVPLLIAGGYYLLLVFSLFLLVRGCASHLTHANSKKCAAIAFGFFLIAVLLDWAARQVVLPNVLPMYPERFSIGTGGFPLGMAFWVAYLGKFLVFSVMFMFIYTFERRRVN